MWPWAGCFPSLFGEVCGRAFRDHRRECDFILSPWGLLQEGALVPRSACGSSHAWPTGVTHSRCAHIRCAVNPRRKVPGRTQWRHCSGGPLGCVSHCRTHACLTHHSAERRHGALLPGALATAGAGQKWSPVSPGPTAARRWLPPACSRPRPQVGAGHGGWVPCGACLLRAGTVSLHLRTLVWGLFLATDEEET